MAITKRTDDKGRVTLGKCFANKMVTIRENDPTEVVVTLVRAIPEREAWLFENPVAKKLVATGLQQAKARQFSASPPDLDADAALADALEDC